MPCWIGRRQTASGYLPTPAFCSHDWLRQVLWQDLASLIVGQVRGFGTRTCNPRKQLRAFALDLGGSTLEEPTDLEIVVVDQNDNRPVFQQEVFTGRVLEGAIPGT